MIVVDASALLEVLLRTPAAARVARRLFARGESLHAPHLLDVEVAQVVRRYWRAGEVAGDRGHEVLEDLAAFPIERYAHALLLPRVWELRHKVTAYDAVYLALAEAIGATLLTRDARLASVPGHRAAVELV